MSSIAQTCQASGEQFPIDDRDQKFYNWIRVPYPTLSPPERWRRRIAFRNDKNFFKGTCSNCQKPIITIYSGQRVFPIYCYECYWSDTWDPLAYGQDFDFNCPFFEQYEELQSRVPRIALFNSKSINSEYTVHSMENKNCYMGGSIGYSEDVYYSNFVLNSKNCIDCLDSYRNEQCYWCIGSTDCYGSNYLENCVELKDSDYCFDCRSCQNVIGCVGLRHREFVVLNQNVSKEQFLEVKKALAGNPDYRKKMEGHFKELKGRYPKKAAYSVNVENSTGNYLLNCKNTFDSFSCEETEDCRYVSHTQRTKNAYDISNCVPAELVYECMGIVDLSFSMFCFLTYYSNNIIYGDNIQGSSNCFGAISLKKQEYVVLNKKVKREEYLPLIQKIVEHMKSTGEWGEFFPIKCSPVSYNESIAQEVFPMSKEFASSRGYTWNDDIPARVPSQIAGIEIPPGLPIKDVSADEVSRSHTCISCQKPFGITPQELVFYKNHGVPLPATCHVCRHMIRKSERNPVRLHTRRCGICSNPVQTSFSEQEPVSCEDCYLKAIY